VPTQTIHPKLVGPFAPIDYSPLTAPSMSDWESLGGGFTSAPAVCSWEPGRLDVFGRGEDFALWHKWFTEGAWSDWEKLGGALTSPPAAVSWGEGRIDVFVRGTDNALWHKWFRDGSWRDWESLGGILNFGPAVCSWGAKRLDVFARGTDNTIFQRTFDGSWGNWSSLAQPVTTSAFPGIAAVSPARGKIYLVMWGSWDVGYLLTDRFYGGTSGIWESPRKFVDFSEAPASLSTSIAAASWRDDHYDVFARDSDQTLFRVAFVEGAIPHQTTYFGSVGGMLTSGPAAVASPDHSGRIDVIARGPDNAYWRKVIT
jgi:hypothetical protein